MSASQVAAGLTREEQAAAEKTLAEWDRYVVKLAFRMRGYAELEDLMQVGRLAVLRAVVDHQPGRVGGMGLPGFVWLYIERGMRNYIRANHALVRAPSDKYMQLRPKVVSMSAPLLPYEKSWEDVLSAEPEMPAPDGDERELLTGALKTLPPRIQHVLSRIDLQGQTLMATAAELAISKERVRQLRLEGLDLLRKRLGRRLERRAA